jgi:hypothetical protein
MRSNRWRVIVVLVVAFTTVSMGVAFSLEANPGHMQWQNGTGSGGGLIESATLFVVGAGLAVFAGALRKLIRRSEFGALAPEMSSPKHSRT